MKKLKQSLNLLFLCFITLLIVAPIHTDIFPRDTSASSEETPSLPHHNDYNISIPETIHQEHTSSNACLSISQENNLLEATFTFQPPELKHSQKHSILDYGKEVKYTTEAGYPHLPYMPKTLTFPLGTTISNIQIATSQIQTIPVPGPMKLASPPLPMTAENTVPPAFKGHKPRGNDNIIYTETYPDKWGAYTLGGGIIQGEHVTFLSVYAFPCRYTPQDNTLSYVEEIKINLTITPPIDPLPSMDTYELVIITVPDFQTSVQPLVDHKQRYGIKTKLVTTREISEETYFPGEGRDEPEKIKYFLKNAHEQWGITNALLIGDITQVPSRQVHSFWYGDHTMYSDHYYADIYDSTGTFCSWDSNKNNLFGELDPERDSSSNDFVDLYADLYIGRLACYDATEVTTVVNKIITYESTTSGTDWFNTLILMGGDTFPYWNDIMEGELVNERVAAVMPEFTPIKIQMSEGNFLPHHMNQVLSEGAGFVCYSGHGFEYGFGTYPQDNNWMIAYYTPYLLALKNEEKLPIIFFDACLTAKLDYYMLGNPNIPCFAWALVKKPNGGAIATIGATETATTTVDETGPWGQAGYLDLHFFMAYHPGVTLAEMLVQAQNDYLNDIAHGLANDRFYVMTLEQFILLGDPTLRPGGYP